jgi:peroxiredoxin Q/BCP
MRFATITAMCALAVCECDSKSTPAPAASASASALSSQQAPPSTSPGAAAGANDLVGKPAPDFTTAAQDGTAVHLAAFKGKPVVLYFYPRDETPGCTVEASSFRDAWDPISKAGAVVIGVSADTLESHKAFAQHHSLPFLLISDPEGSIGHLYGVPFHGVHQRETFVIGADGNVRKAYRQVDVSVHAKQILEDLKAS